jgi:hypothetical protein
MPFERQPKDTYRLPHLMLAGMWHTRRWDHGLLSRLLSAPIAIGFIIVGAPSVADTLLWAGIHRKPSAPRFPPKCDVRTDLGPGISSKNG